jgi:hypothetical protein
MLAIGRVVLVVLMLGVLGELVACVVYPALTVWETNKAKVKRAANKMLRTIGWAVTYLIIAILLIIAAISGLIFFAILAVFVFPVVRRQSRKAGTHAFYLARNLERSWEKNRAKEKNSRYFLLREV